MAKKRKKRRNRMSLSSAVIRFLIGMLLIGLIVFAGFYLLFEVDYTQHLRNSDGTYASTRAYVLPADGSTLAPILGPATETPVATAPGTPEPTDAPEVTDANATAIPDITDAPDETAVPDETNAPAETDAPATIDEPAATATPEATAAPSEEPTPTPEPLIIITTLEPTPTPEVTPVPTPEPTSVPTPMPTPYRAPTPEPDGTRIPKDAFSDYRTDLKAPRAYKGEGLNVGLSRCYTSRLNYYQVMQVNGWGFIDLPGYNGLTATTYALVTPVGEKQGRVYLCTNREGISRRIHHPQLAENAGAADFEVTIDTSDYADGQYELKLILQFIVDEENYVFLCPFPQPRTFTVVSGEILTPIPID